MQQSQEAALPSSSTSSQRQQASNINSSSIQSQNNTLLGNVAPNSPGLSNATHANVGHINGGRFDFEDGGTFCGGWEDSKAHGHGVCTGPKNQGAYSGAWHYGFEVSGVYTWPSGSSFEGQWQNGKRHGLGIETRGRWIYRGEWTQGFKGRYGVRQSATSTAKYEGTWANGLQDGYGSETYADGGTYQGQWLRGMRHGYGVRQSAPFGLAARFRPKSIRASLTSLRSNEGSNNQAPTPDPAEKRNHRIDDARGGFVLKAKSDEPPVRRNSLVEKTKKSILGIKIRKQRSTGDLEKRGTGSGSVRSTASSASWLSTDSSQSGMTNKSMHTDSNASFIVEDEQLDGGVTESYMGEWKNDKRSGYGISERSDGLKYEGEWFANKKYGYGVTTLRNGTKEEGKYKNNVLITSQKKRHLFLIRSAKFRERIDAAVDSSQRASKYALQKADIAISRTATARGKAELADIAADHAKVDSDVAITTAREFAPDFKPSLLERFERIRTRERYRPPPDDTIKINAQSKPVPNLSPNDSTNVMESQQQKQFTYQQELSRGAPFRNTNQATPINNTNSNSIDYNTNNQMNQQTNYSIKNSQLTGSIYGTPQNKSGQQYNNNLNNLQNAYSQSHSSLQKSIQNNLTYPQQQNQNIETYGGSSNAQQINSDSTQYQLQQQVYQENSSVRRNSKQLSNRPPLATLNQSSIDHFDHYKRPPSRESSVDRYTKAANKLGGGNSRQSSVDRTGTGINQNFGIDVLERSIRASSQFKDATPAPMATGNGVIPSGNTINYGRSSRAATPLYQSSDNPITQPSFTNQNQPFEDVLLRQRNLGQDIIPSLAQPKRTESLYLASKPILSTFGASAGGGNTGGGGGGGGVFSRKPKSIPVTATLQRKKSLPDVQQLPHGTGAMSREEVSVLGSARREEVRRQINESERLRANPLLYLVSPQVKDWFSRQQLVMLVLIINIALAIMFFKMLT